MCRYENTEKRKLMVAEKGLLYMGMGVSGGEEGARNGECKSRFLLNRSFQARDFRERGKGFRLWRCCRLVRLGWLQKCRPWG